jgi:trk system potassium uptake protein
LGIIIQGIGLVMLIPIIVALIYDEQDIIGFLTFGTFSIGVEYVLRRLSADETKLKLKIG